MKRDDLVFEIYFENQQSNPSELRGEDSTAKNHPSKVCCFPPSLKLEVTTPVRAS